MKHKGSPSYLKYFVPIAYYEQAKKDLLDPGIEERSAVEINKEMGIEVAKSVNVNTTPSLR